MKIKAQHSKSNRINRELHSTYALIEAHFILIDKVVENKWGTRMREVFNLESVPKFTISPLIFIIGG